MKKKYISPSLNLARLNYPLVILAGSQAGSTTGQITPDSDLDDNPFGF